MRPPHLRLPSLPVPGPPTVRCLPVLPLRALYPRVLRVRVFRAPLAPPALLALTVLVVLSALSLCGARPAAAYHSDGRRDAGAPDDPGERAWPVAGAGGALRPLVVRGWDPPASPWAAGHRGVDLATLPGRPVRAAAGGRVSFAGPVAGRGVVTVEIAGTGRPPLRTTFEPVHPVVAEGDRVRAGSLVGRVQNGPFHCGRACLHWGLLRGGTYLDPLSLLPSHMLGGPARLLPYLGRPVPEHDAAPAPRMLAAGSAEAAGAPAGPSAGTLSAAAGLAGLALWAHRGLRGPGRISRRLPGGPWRPRPP